MYSQGVHGAYSESAAEKAYPNCQAVPCEQFDAAFEVKNKILQSFTLEYKMRNGFRSSLR